MPAMDIIPPIEPPSGAEQIIISPEAVAKGMRENDGYVVGGPDLENGIFVQFTNPKEEN